MLFVAKESLFKAVKMKRIGTKSQKHSERR